MTTHHSIAKEGIMTEILIWNIPITINKGERLEKQDEFKKGEKKIYLWSD